MELSEEVTKGLGVLSDVKIFSDAAFKALVQLAADILLKQKTEDAIKAEKELASLDPLFVKQAYSGAVSFMLEAAKWNSDGMLVKGQLEGCRMPEGRREIFEKIYSATREQLRRLLFTTGFNFANVVGVDWRLDYYIKSDKLDRIDIPIYIINIKTEEAGQAKDVQFACTQEELQDLVTKLRQAVKEVDRIAQG